MSTNSGGIERRSPRSERYRMLFRTYRAGFVSVLSLIILSEIELDLSNQIGERVRFRLNPSAEVQNQTKVCK